MALRTPDPVEGEELLRRAGAGYGAGVTTRVRFSIREARREDKPFLCQMLYEATTWRPGQRRFSPKEVLSPPEIDVYISGWRRPGDEGLIAEADTGESLGAAWYRLFSEEAHGFGFVNAETPEITIAVREDVRGRGIGSALLDGLIARARRGRLSALSLSVEADNPALRLYERAAFRVIRGDKVLTMIRDLSSAKPYPASGP
jgi:ribosomal protein S18 acetylase RimI-like enzyme